MLFWPGLAALVAAVALLSAPARAASAETTVKAHKAVVDVERTGVATVTHEVTLGVRAGTLQDLEIQGVDPDAELVSGDARLTRVASGKDHDPRATTQPIPLLLSRTEEGTLGLEVQSDPSLHTGTYVLFFAYRTNLLARERLRRRGAVVEVEWVSPRFADGIEAATVVFRLPEGPFVPEIPRGPDAEASDLGSVFVSAVRHEAGKVEVEVVRPHVARGEPAVFRLEASPKCFDALAAPRPRQPSSERHSSPAASPDYLGGSVLPFVVALAYALLVALKSVLHARDCEAAAAEIRPLVPLPLGVRAALAGALLAAAMSLGVLGDHPTFAALLLLLALSLAALRPCKPRLVPRGPGRWLVLTDADAFQGDGERGRCGRFLDIGTRAGVLTLVLLLLATSLGALFLLPRSPYHVLAVALGSSAFLPIFGTGRRVSLPFDRARSPGKLLRALARRLRARGIKAVPYARIPDGSQDPDELRLLVRAPGAQEGLFAIEVGVEALASPAGFIGLPFVLVRVRADSAAHAAFSEIGSQARGERFQRGRRTDERIRIFRPALPGRAHVLALVEQVVTQAAGAPRVSSRKTRGAGASTSNLGVRSPAHAT